jgi:hypothetical protein
MINYTDDHKNDEIVEKIVHLQLTGNAIEKKNFVWWLPSDWKKKTCKKSKSNALRAT